MAVWAPNVAAAAKRGAGIKGHGWITLGPLFPAGSADHASEMAEFAGLVVVLEK